MNHEAPLAVPLSGHLYRIANYDTPFWVRANSSPGRFHRPEHGLSVQYWSTTPHAAWAEHLRRESITDPADLELMRSRLWAAYWRLTSLADLTTPQWQQWCDVTPRALVAPTHARCQAAGAKVRELDLDGLITPSAAIAGGINVVVFGPRATGDWVAQPDGEAAKLPSTSFVPAQLAATGQPDPDLLGHVRQR